MHTNKVICSVRWLSLCAVFPTTHGKDSMARQQRKSPSKRQAREWMAAAESCAYLPPPNCGKVPKGVVLRGYGEPDRRAQLLDRAASEWLRASKNVGRSAITDKPYRRNRGRSQAVGMARLHGSGPRTTL